MKNKSGSYKHHSQRLKNTYVQVPSRTTELNTPRQGTGIYVSKTNVLMASPVWELLAYSPNTKLIQVLSETDNAWSSVCCNYRFLFTT